MKNCKKPPQDCQETSFKFHPWIKKFSLARNF
jgi:hypothetical protein